MAILTRKFNVISHSYVKFGAFLRRNGSFNVYYKELYINGNLLNNLSIEGVEWATVVAQSAE